MYVYDKKFGFSVGAAIKSTKTSSASQFCLYTAKSRIKMHALS